ncbi:MAG: hypothetical protein M3P96_00975 [Actinomycetota bacterium]|nr:hypothetical protein [Actinomycetota bacterium]
MSEQGGTEPELESGMGGADTGGDPDAVSPAGITEAEAREVLEQVGGGEESPEQPTA